MTTISSPRPQSPHIPNSPSTTPTPNSSVRASLDLHASTSTNARSPSPGPAVATTTQRRNRAALRDYYNLKSKPPGPGPQNFSRTASIASTTSSATVTSTAVPDARTSTDLDSSTTSISTAALDDPSFEAEPYIASLLATSNLKTVLKVEANLISEIRNLDGERKALVYDNYSKLIKATRTIGTMRMNMNGEERGVGGTGRLGERRRSGGLSEDGMQDLEERVEEVRKLAQELRRAGNENQGQEERRKAREEGEKRQLVKWVLEGPLRLQKMVEDGQVQVAQAEWKIIRGLLDKWEGVKGVEETRKACEEALRPAQAEGENNGAS